MKNIADIAKKIQTVNQYTFKKKDESGFFDEGMMNQINELNGFIDVSQIHQNNLSEINFNKELNLVNEMIPLTNPNNVSEINLNPNIFYNNSNYTGNINVMDESKIVQEKGSASGFKNFVDTIPKRNRSNTMKDSYVQNHAKKNFKNSNVNITNMQGHNETMNVPTRKSEFNNGHLAKFITNNKLDQNNSSNLILSANKTDRLSVVQDSGRKMNSLQSGFEINSYRDRSQMSRDNNSFTNYEHASMRGVAKNIEQLSANNNYNVASASPKFLPTFSHHPYNLNHNYASQNNYNNYNHNDNGNGKNQTNYMIPGSSVNSQNSQKKRYSQSNENNQTNYYSNQNNQYSQFNQNNQNNNSKKNSKIFDYIKPPPVKKGIFSYTKPNPPQYQNETTNSPMDLNSFLTNVNNNTTMSNGIGLFGNFSNYNNLNAISRHLSALQNNQEIITRDGSQSLLDNSHISLVEKYKINKDRSNANLNKSDNPLDETDKISVKSMSTSSVNLNKYKIGSAVFPTSKHTIVNDNTGISDLSTLIKYENSTNNANYGKVVMGGVNNQNLLNKKLESTEQLEPWRENSQFPTSNNDRNIPFEMDNYSGNISSRKEALDKPAMIAPSKFESIFKNKPAHEKESRRMQIELVKMNMREKKSIGKEFDLMKILNELKLNPLILDKQRGGDIETNSKILNENKTNDEITKKNTLIDDPRLQNILKRGTVNAVNPVRTMSTNNYPSEIQNFSNKSFPISESPSSFITDTIKSTAQLNYSLEEDSDDKINMLCFLATPRILHINVTNNNKIQRIPFIFQLSPTNACHKHGLEHYIFQWNDLNTLTTVKYSFKLKMFR